MTCSQTSLPSVDKDTHGFDGQKNAHAASKPLAIHKVLPADFSLPERISAPSKLLAPDSDGFLCDFCFLRRRRAVTLIYQIKAQRSGFDLRRKKEIAECSFCREAEAERCKLLLTRRKDALSGVSAPANRYYTKKIH